MSKALEYAYRAAIAWIDGLEDRPVAAQIELKELADAFNEGLPEKGSPPEQVIAAIVQNGNPGMLGSAGGRFFAWVIGGSVESALAADWMVATWDQNAALYACSPAAAIIEERAGEWIKQLLELPQEASFAFTTVCQMAHMTCLAASRHALLQRNQWDVESKGLFGAPQIAVLTSDQKHDSIERAVRFLGLGRNAIVSVPTDCDGKIVVSQFRKILSSVSVPAIAVLNAADLNIGACDPFRELITIAHDYGAWVHVDGAFGLLARASRAFRHHLDGVELADSWATDGHKWLNVPFDCGIAIVRDRVAHRSAMHLSAAYISPNLSARDQIDWNPEWSRRARGIPVLAALKELGREGIEELVDRCCASCRMLVISIGSLAGAEILRMPVLNQGLVRFRLEHHTEDEADVFTDEVIRRINATGKAFFSGTTWRGKRAMRISVVNWRTTSADVEKAIAAARIVLTEWASVPSAT